MRNTRRVPRVLVRDVLDVEVGLAPYRARDLSTLGIRVAGREELRERSVEPLRIAEDSAPLLLGRVAWCRREDDHVEAGLEFIGLTAAERARLRERVEALQQA